MNIRHTGTDLFIYYNRELIAKHRLLPAKTKNGKRTDPSHLPYPQFEHTSTDKAIETAGSFGKSVKELAIQFRDNSKIKEQAILSINALLRLT